MHLYFRVRSVLLSRDSSALTLSPGEWLVESATETETIDGETYPKLIVGLPSDPGAEFDDEGGGKMTELRVDGQTDLRPGDLVTVTVERAAR